MKSALIIGGRSMIAQALSQKLGELGVAHTALVREQLDLSASPDAWPTLPAAEVVYLCAATTKLEVCEREPEDTRRVNVLHMQQLAERVQTAGGFVVFLSSNQVFDGSRPHRKPSDLVSPMNEYGRQKAAMESWLLSRPQPAAVLRLTKVQSGELPILATWREALLRGEMVEAFDDLIFAPVALDRVVDALVLIGHMRRAGISQCSGLRDQSYYELALALAASLGVDAALVKPVSATSKGILPQFLPRYGSLENREI